MTDLNKTKRLIILGCLLGVMPFYNNCSGGFSALSASGLDSSSSSSDGQGSSPAQSATGWNVLKVGAGGYLSGIDISNDGTTKVVRTDTYGAYIWDSTSSKWKQLVNPSSMPAAYVMPSMNGPVHELRVAPNLATRMYMATGGTVFRSDNRGQTWSKLPMSDGALLGSDGYRTWGQKMAIDPINPDVVYLGTPDSGLFRTVDGGQTWTQITAVPNAGQANGTYAAGYTGIAFDPTSGSTNGKTNTIYVPGFGNGVYRSTDAGNTWALLSGGPTTVQHAKVASDGSYYAAGLDGSLWRYRVGAWQNITPQYTNVITVAIHPQNTSLIIAQSDSGQINISRDGGATWSGRLTQTRQANDIPWLAWTNEGYMSASDIQFDPLNPNTIWFAEGIGVWTTDVSTTPATVVWDSHSAGIEQLCTNEIVVPPGGNPIVASWDRPIFDITNPDVYPSTHGPDRNDSILMGWSVDWASSQPSFVVGLMNWAHEDSGYSTDGGATWQKFASYPPLFSNGKLGGGIAASTPSNFVWFPNNNGTPYYTLDGGATWTQATFPNAPTGSETGWGWAHYFKRQIVTADRVLPNTFYANNYLTGLYRSTDGGKTWAQIYNKSVGEWAGYHAKLRSVPGQAGHLFFSSGTQGSGTDMHPGNIPFRRSTDGGVTWSDVPGAMEVLAFGFGKAAVGQTYPAIYIAGWVNGIYGIYRSKDNATTWEPLGAWPTNSLDMAVTIEGDMNVYGRVYLGFGGSGSAYGQFN